MYHVVKKLGLLLLAVLVSTPASVAQSMDSAAEHAILLEMGTGEVLFEKLPDEPFPPASMSKMMTVYIVFEQLKRGELALEDTTTVSTSAWKRWAGTEASLMFLGEGEEVSVANLLRGIIVSSGNDACTVVAEMLAGSEDGFADWMNDKAKELGMSGSRFANASGWPAPDQYVTARDLATLAQKTIENFPEYYPIYAEKDFTYGTDFQSGKPIRQSNRNPLLYRMDGADGLKTGHTEAAGYGLTASAERDGRRLIGVVSGLTSTSERARESQRLMEYGFRNFKTYDLFAAGETVGEADLWLGTQPVVPLLVEEPVRLTLSRRDRNSMKVVLSYENPIAAPVERGQPVANLAIRIEGQEDRVIPLVAGVSADRVGGFAKIGAAIEYLLFGASTAAAP